MFGHVKNEYDGYDQNPDSPTEYTVNRRPKQARRPSACWPPRPLAACLALAVLLAVLLIVATILLLRPCRCQETLPYNCSESLVAEATISPEASAPVVNIPIPRNDDLHGDQMEINLDPEDEDDDVGGDATMVSEQTYLTKEEDEEKLESIRLPRSLKPIKYRVQIIPSVDTINKTTDGEVAMQFVCLETTKKITFNSKQIKIIKESILVFSVDHSNDLYTLHDVYENEKTQMYTIELVEELVSGRRYDLKMKFVGQIDKANDYGGIRFTNSFDASTNKTNWLLSTAFSPYSARKAFPCFDEPDMKALFTFKIARPRDYVVISNMPIQRTEPVIGRSNWAWDEFEETHLLPTYLTAFTIAPFKPLINPKETSKQRIRFNAYAKTLGAPKLEIALEWTRKFITFFENLFDIKYTYPKLDIVAVPDYKYDGMEHPGAIFFREDKIYASDYSSDADLKDLAALIAHEVCHQWFGNLVTQEWWNDVWIKEGGSEFFTHYALERMRPGWSTSKFIRNIQNSLSQDGVKTAVAMSAEFNKLSSASDVFNYLPYKKGYAIFNMLFNIIGESRIRQGAQSFLKDFSLKNANHDDLWKAFENAMGRGPRANLVGDIKTIMDSWILQAGYPVVTITRDYSKGSAVVTQKRFFIDVEKNENNDTSLWWVPLFYTSQEESDLQKRHPKVWLNATPSIEISNIAAADSWVLANLEYKGHYLVNYDAENWIHLINNYRTLPEIIRSQLIYDSLLLALGGELSYDYALSILSQLSIDVDEMPWKVAAPTLKDLRRSLISMPAFGNFRGFVRAIILRVYEQYIARESVWDNIMKNKTWESHTANILSIACHFEHENCVINAKRIFEEWMMIHQSGRPIANPIPASYRNDIYCTAVKVGGKAEWNFVLVMYQQSLKSDSTVDERKSLLNALGCASEQWLLTRSLGLINEPAMVLTKDEMTHLFQSVANNHVGNRIAVNFIRANWRQLLERYGNPSSIYQMVAKTVTYVNSPYDIEDLKSLVADIKNTTKEESTLLDGAVDMAINYWQWMKKYYPSIDRWLQQFIERHNVIV